MKNYRNLRFSNINTPEFSHLKLLLFWPIFGILFLLVERVIPLQFHEVYCSIDDLIPFCEYFVIPYYMWFAFLIGMSLYLLLEDIPGFRKYMLFIMVSYFTTIVIYLIYPTCQTLRPIEFTRDNIFTSIVSYLYNFDTNTNVCPSIHVLGMMAVTFAGLRTPRLQGVGWKIFWIISAIFVCLSTVFLKQHSIIDVIAALILTLPTYWLVYKLPLHRKNPAKI